MPATCAVQGCQNVGPVQVLTVLVRPDDPLQFHSHSHPHAQLVQQGEGDLVLQEPDQPIQRRPMKAGEAVNVPAGWGHAFVARSELVVLWCVMPHRNAAGELVEESVGEWVEAAR